jgi:mycoredoxin
MSIDYDDSDGEEWGEKTMADKIKLYGTSWCPDTARARACLEKCKVQFIWCDIEKDAQGCTFVEQINKGKRRVPTIVFPDGIILVEPSNSELEKRVEAIKGAK